MPRRSHAEKVTHGSTMKPWPAESSSGSIVAWPHTRVSTRPMTACPASWIAVWRRSSHRQYPWAASLRGLPGSCAGCGPERGPQLSLASSRSAATRVPSWRCPSTATACQSATGAVWSGDHNICGDPSRTRTCDLPLSIPLRLPPPPHRRAFVVWTIPSPWARVAYRRLPSGLYTSPAEAGFGSGSPGPQRAQGSPNLTGSTSAVSGGALLLLAKAVALSD